MRDRLRAITFALREAWQVSPTSTIFGFAEVVMRAILGARPAMYGLIVGGIAAGELHLALIGGALLLLTEAPNLLIQLWGLRYRVGLMQALADRFEGRTAILLASLPTLAHQDDPAAQDEVQALRERGGVIGVAYNNVVNALGSIAGPVTAVLVAVGADWRLVLLALAGIPQVLITGRISRIHQEAETASAEEGRRSESLLRIAASRSGAGELRSFGARNFLRGRLRSSTDAWMTPSVTATRRASGWTLATTVLYLLVAAAVITWVGLDALTGAVTLAALTVALTSVESLRDAVGSIRMAITQLDTSTRYIARYRWLQDRVRTEEASHAGTIAPPETLHSGIRLDDVSLVRPGSEHPALDHVTLDLPAGSTVALVGENGAGKTTLVDLLLGLHDPTTGRIEVDGTPLGNLDLTDWRSRCAGAFQDHARFEVQARRAVGLGDLPVLDDDSRVRHALQQASATAVLTALPKELDTQLGNGWPGGVGLSGGQWQRLAIARGMMRRGPLLLVLDEPTSALDPATEDALFTSYAEAAGTTRDAGGITLLVTHRFSTVSAADLVVVLDQGQIAEIGTHAELMGMADGRYRELYTLQARGYS